MRDWDEQPEAMGPQSEGTLFGAKYGDPGYPTIGRPPRQMSIEQMEKERDAAARAWERRQQIERAAIAAGVDALQAADRIEREAAEIAAKADVS